MEWAVRTGAIGGTEEEGIGTDKKVKRMGGIDCWEGKERFVGF